MENKDFVLYPEAFELKQLGFDEPCLSYYSTDGKLNRSLLEYPIAYKNNFHESYKIVIAPLYQQAFRWFREKHQLYAWVKVEYEYGGITPTYYITGKRQGDIAGGPFNTHEEAELACLVKLIEIVKQKNENQI